MDAPMRCHRCRYGPARATGSAGVAVWLLLFVTLFGAFEILHPVADLLHEHAHCVAAAEGVPSPGTQPGDGTVRDSHGPVALGAVAPTLCPHGAATVAGVWDELPESPVLEPRSPVPIFS